MIDKQLSSSLSHAETKKVSIQERSRQSITRLGVQARGFIMNCV